MLHHKYVVQLVPTLICWCFPDVESSLWLLKPCVGNDRPFPFTETNEHVPCLISSS